MESLTKFIGVLTMILILLFYGVFVWPLVMMKYYYWFMPNAGIFTTAPHLSYFNFMAIYLLLIVIKPSSGSSEIKDEYKDTSKGITISMISPWFILLLGWFLHLIIF